jgi:hypothetical protein
MDGAYVDWQRKKKISINGQFFTVGKFNEKRTNCLPNYSGWHWSAF